MQEYIVDMMKVKNKIKGNKWRWSKMDKEDNM